jgi:hypothetical protein
MPDTRVGEQSLDFIPKDLGTGVENHARLPGFSSVESRSGLGDDGGRVVELGIRPALGFKRLRVAERTAEG